MNEERVNPSLIRGYGTLAGLGIIGAAVVAVPSTLLLDPVPPAEHYLATVAALVVGLICMALPWERMDARWLHLVGLAATAQAAVAVVLFGQVYAAFYFLIAITAAYMTATWKELNLQLAFISVALFGPVLWGPQEPADTLQLALVVFPLLCLTAGIFAYLRHRMVADQSSYRVFAEETLALANRIAGRPVTAGQPQTGEADLPAWSNRVRVSTRVAGLAAFTFALPLVTAGLAVAGVKLPDFAASSFRSVGVDLPNQGDQNSGQAAPSLSWDDADVPSRERESRELPAGEVDRPGAGGEGRSGGAEASPGSDNGPLPGDIAYEGGSTESVPASEEDQGGLSGGASGGGAGQGDILGDTTNILDDILGGGNREGADVGVPEVP